MQVYIYKGNEDETVPDSVEKLIIGEGVQVLPRDLCNNIEARPDYSRLKEVTLANGLIKIGDRAFCCCENILEINICGTVQVIGFGALHTCRGLRNVDFKSLTSAPHQLREISGYAFYLCSSLLRVKLPPSVSTMGESAFASCDALVEANLSATCIDELSRMAFSDCRSLQTVSLPNTLRRIGNYAFDRCWELVTLLLPLDSQPLEIGLYSFNGCTKLANFVLPKGSTRRGQSFDGMKLMFERYGNGDSRVDNESRVLNGLMGRFDEYPVHRMCYDQSAITGEKMLQCIAETQEDAFVDNFGMTPFHVFFSTVEPKAELAYVLLQSLPNQMLYWKDVNERRPLEYLISNWTDWTKRLLQRTLQHWMIDRVACWGGESWTETMQGKVEAILAEEEKEQRSALCNEAYSTLEHFENVAATSILEMALWKGQLKSGRATDGSKRQALDRDDCRYLSKSNIVIPHVLSFMDSSGDDSSEEEEDDYDDSSEHDGLSEDEN